MIAWHYSPYAAASLASAAISAAVALVAWRRRGPGARPFALSMLCAAVWSLAYSLELAASDAATALLCVRLEYLGGAWITTAWLAFVLAYTGRGRWLTRGTSLALSAMPAATLLLAWTNGYHGLVMSEVSVDAGGPFTVVQVRMGPWNLLYIPYSYLLLLAATLLLLRQLATALRPFRGQAAALLVAALAPWAADVLGTLGLSPVPNLDLVPFAFTLTGAATAWSLLRHRLLDLVPVARDALVEGMEDGVVVLDAGGLVADLNPAAQRALGLAPPDALGRPLAEVLPCPPGLAGLRRGEAEAPREVAWGEGGARRWYDVRASQLRDGDGHPAGRMVVLRDVTERKRAEEEVRGARERLEKTFAALDDALLILDDGEPPEIVSCNAAASRVFGWGADELKGRPIVVLHVSEGTRREFRRVVDRAVAEGGRLVCHELAMMRKGGEAFPAELSVIPLAGGGGGRSGWVAVIRDITARKRAKEEALSAKAHAELLADLMSHDILNDNQVSQGFLELMLGGGRLGGEDRSYAEDALGAARRSTELVENVKMMGRIGAWRRERPEWTGLRGAVSEAAGAVRLRHPGADIRIEVRVPGGLEAPASPFLVDLLLNLLDNAVRYDPHEAKEVEVRAEPFEEGGRPMCRVLVSDRGVGIPDDAKERVFGRFSRGARGTGLGLSIVRAVAESLGGRARAEDRVPGDRSEGSVLVVELPRHDRA